MPTISKLSRGILCFTLWTFSWFKKNVNYCLQHIKKARKRYKLNRFGSFFRASYFVSAERTRCRLKMLRALFPTYALSFSSVSFDRFLYLVLSKNSALTGVKHNLKGRSSFEKFKKDEIVMIRNLPLRWLDTVLVFSSFILMKYKVLFICKRFEL